MQHGGFADIDTTTPSGGPAGGPCLAADRRTVRGHFRQSATLRTPVEAIM